jgi:hypothetical protein
MKLWKLYILTKQTTITAIPQQSVRVNLFSANCRDSVTSPRVTIRTLRPDGNGQTMDITSLLCGCKNR